MKTINNDYPYYEVDPISTIPDMLANSARKYANNLALQDLNPTPIPRVTYHELKEHVLTFGTALKQLGLKERDHVAFIGENRVQWAITHLACVTFNFVAVPIDKNLKENDIVNILHVSDSKAAVFSEPFRDMFIEFKHSVKALKHLVDMDLARKENGVHSMMELMAKAKHDAKKAQFATPNPDEVCVIVFTSGSMGRAKGVMMTHRNLCTNLMDMRQMIRIEQDDRFLSVLPMHHTYEGTCGFLCPVYAGASVYYSRSLKTIVEDMQKASPTIFLGVPLMYDKMYRRIMVGIQEKGFKKAIVPPMKTIAAWLEAFGAEKVRRKIFSEIHEKFGGAIRLFIAGGAAPDPQVSKGLRSFGIKIIQGYGLTETSPILTVNREFNFKDEAAGVPLPSVQLKIANPDSSGHGEIIARGPSVMPGYYKNEAATAEVMHDGWFYTGDIGFIDKDGFLHINGRKKNVIVARNGENVYPEELEDKVNRIPFVLESVIYGGKDEKNDEEIRVMIVPHAETFIEYAQKNKIEVTTELIEKILNDEIRALNKHLLGHQQIKKVKVRDKEFEKTTTQKIKRYLLQQEDSVR
ncbi:MAG: AMP-binding protein [Bacteroidetes bacterium]|nr:AMP-binding protein [Bacteroidota bacterium]MCW5896646.1 AMP-binding protein [Bacteroidota bacterium]